jgi:NAD(P)-dependent dehydrogenase (short-subunit alcohol dehydrogenase family)
MHGVNRGRPGRAGDAVIVTGAGEGIGLEIALALTAAGFRVFATVRNIEQEAELLVAAAARELAIESVHLELTDPASVTEAVATVVARAGGLYGLVNNAGIDLRGACEDCSPDEIRLLFETNVLGTIALTQAVIPHLRSERRGRIVTVTSVGGRVCGFGVTMYCASKFAQEGLGEGLAQELAPFGIQSVIVEPGIVNTSRWSRNRGTAQRASDPSSPYHELFWASEAITDRLVARSHTLPEHVAHTITHALTTGQPRMRYVVGRPAALVLALRRYLPQSLFERLYYGLHIRRLEAARSAREQHPTMEAASR